MAYRVIYKNGEEFVCKSLARANEMVENEGYSWTPVKKTAKPKKAKVEVEAVELKPVEGEDSKVIDFGKIDEEK